MVCIHAESLQYHQTNTSVEYSTLYIRGSPEERREEVEGGAWCVGQLVAEVGWAVFADS